MVKVCFIRTDVDVVEGTEGFPGVTAPILRSPLSRATLGPLFLTDHCRGLRIRSVDTPRISIGPADYHISRGLSEARLGYRDGRPNWGPRDPG